MKYPGYHYTTEADLLIFEFESVGVKGKIKKIVQYTEMSVKGYYNLAFGDYEEATKEMNDDIVTNNGDGPKVLSTVVSTLYTFTSKYPDARVFATGNSESRTRLYRMGISNNLKELREDFVVYGLRSDEVFEEFEAGTEYLGFQVIRKR